MLLNLLVSAILLPCVALSLDVFDDDVFGLLVFKSRIQDPEARLASWNDGDDDPCNWVGVRCDHNSSRVIDLALDGFSLSGQISRGLLRLQSLQRLSLSNNNLSGSISPDLAHLWSLQVIDLSHNSLSGSIPAELFQRCGSLRSVSFAINGLTGEIPDSLGSCTSLETVNFSSNQLSGKLPGNIWSLSGLKYLDLSYNLLQGEIPRGIGNMSSLQVISLRKNVLSGQLPHDIGSCLHLQSLDFSENSFSGLLPDSLQKLNVCNSLSLHGNILSGEVPYWIGQMRTLETLDISFNKFSGRIPSSIGNLQSLKVLNLSSNGFIGDLPATMSNCVNLLAVDVSRNYLRGLIPNWMFKLGMCSISLSGNKFIGNIKFPLFGSSGLSYQTLQLMDLSLNAVLGVIPAEIGAFGSLQYLNLSGNFLEGAIPANIGDLSSAQFIDLSYNQLNGSIPMEIGGAVSLKELRLGKNALTGIIPSQIENCSSLTTLILSENNLDGVVPLALANLSNLEVVDLSQNNLSGSLPKELADLSRLLLFNVSNNHLEGELPVGGFFSTIPPSSVSSNPSLCGSIFNRSCPAIHPKPIVLNPNFSNSSSDSLPPSLRHKKFVLSISASIAVGAAAFIFLGVVAISILNLYARNSDSHSAAPFGIYGKDDCSSQSSISDPEYGKLLMFSGDANFGEGAHALLNKDCELGRGGFGAVYHTVLCDGRSVAIKKLTISNLIKSQDDFEREVKMLGKLRHPNLVALEGYYWTSSLQLLINEYVPGSSLHKHLHDDSASGCLTWHRRFKIIMGMAKGLAYLHQFGIIHCSLKSTNILLDGYKEPKVGDFGLARLLPMVDRYILSSKVQSALGYMAPEFACSSVKITEKSDIYGFGILVLEVVTGKKPVEYMEDDVVVLCDMVRGALEKGILEDFVDRRLHGNFPEDKVISVVKLGLICASQVPSNRPDMTEVISILELLKCPPEAEAEVD